MDLSLNEVEAQAYKATKGAGYEWGEAAETGRAIRWLCQNGIDGCHHLAAHLPSSPDLQVMPHCPIKAGLHFADFAHDITAGKIMSVDVSAPLIFLAFAANASKTILQPISVVGQNWSAVTDGNCLAITGSPSPDRQNLEIAISSEGPAAAAHYSRAHPDQETWHVLAQFAHRTYAPATDASRERGAGAGLLDND